MCRHWNEIFDIPYSYAAPFENRNFIIKEGQQIDSELLQVLKELSNDDSMKIENSYFGVPNDDFFRYNVLADELRTYVNGAVFYEECWEGFKRNVDKMDFENFV